MDPRRRLTLVNLLSHDWLCGRVDVPATPLMTPDVLDMSGSHVGTALRVAMNAYHKAARTGFTLMDVSNAPLAKRRKKKNFSSESQKGSDDSVETTDGRLDSEPASNSRTRLAVPDRRDFEAKLSVGDDMQRKIPALAVCLSPSVSRQSIVDTIATNSEPPPLRPISGDCECILSQNSANSADSNFFFKDFHDTNTAQVYSLGHDRPASAGSRHHTKDLGHGCFKQEGTSQGTDSNVAVQSVRGQNQYTCSAQIPTSKQPRPTTETDAMNNNIIDIALSGLREGNRAWKRPHQP